MQVLISCGILQDPFQYYWNSQHLFSEYLNVGIYLLFIEEQFNALKRYLPLKLCFMTFFFAICKKRNITTPTIHNYNAPFYY